MRELLRVSIVIALLIGATALAVTAGDRELFVPPPEAVAEGFMREVVTRRYDCAADYLAERKADPEQIRHVSDAIEQRLGRVDDIQTETIARTDEKALVEVRLKSAIGSHALELGLLWSNGEWRIERVP